MDEKKTDKRTEKKKKTRVKGIKILIGNRLIYFTHATPTITT